MGPKITRKMEWVFNHGKSDSDSGGNGNFDGRGRSYNKPTMKTGEKTEVRTSFLQNIAEPPQLHDSTSVKTPSGPFARRSASRRKQTETPREQIPTPARNFEPHERPSRQLRSRSPGKRKNPALEHRAVTPNPSG